ncbi:MAG: 4Fe-4S binding protein [Elusimicrobia bacterium]|nr:4Fe-4S binding protein [Candidatus Liberimonas magnetica]
MKNTATKNYFRYLTILTGMFLFLSPFAVIPQLAGEVNLCGAVCPRMFFILSPSGITKGLLNGISADWFGAGLVGLILTVTFFFGRLWCGRFCPIGGTSELASRLIPKKLHINYSFLNAPSFRYAYLFIFIAGALIGIGGISCKLCNFRVIPFLAGSPFVPGYRTYLMSSIGLAGIFTVSAAGFFADRGRAYCNLLCPVGALDGIMNFFSSKLGFTLKTRTDLAKCNGCGICTPSCMVWALEVGENKKLKRDQSSCMSCGECVKVCPRKAIRYARS